MAGGFEQGSGGEVCWISVGDRHPSEEDIILEAATALSDEAWSEIGDKSSDAKASRPAAV